jgi:hypothetical protein
VVVEELQGATDKENIGRVPITLVDAYIAEEIKKQTHGEQISTTARPRAIQDFSIITLGIREKPGVTAVWGSLAGHARVTARCTEEHMRRCKIGISIVVVVLCGLSASGAQPERAAGPLLFTLQEAERLRLTEEEWTQPLRAQDVPLGAGEVSLGPRIVVQRPQVRETTQGAMLETFTPLDLLVVFEARGAAVDMPSLRVQARKGIFTKSLTETLQPYIRGMRVEAMAVQVPEGRFAIQIDIADLQGRKTSETYRLEVKRQ